MLATCAGSWELHSQRSTDTYHLQASLVPLQCVYGSEKYRRLLSHDFPPRLSPLSLPPGFRVLTTRSPCAVVRSGAGSCYDGRFERGEITRAYEEDKASSLVSHRAT